MFCSLFLVWRSPPHLKKKKKLASLFHQFHLKFHHFIVVFPHTLITSPSVFSIIKIMEHYIGNKHSEKKKYTSKAIPSPATIIKTVKYDSINIINTSSKQPEQPFLHSPKHKFLGGRERLRAESLDGYSARRSLLAIFQLWNSWLFPWSIVLFTRSQLCF